MTAPTIADESVLVVGTGYLGRRFLDSQNARSVIGLSRSDLKSTQHVEVYDLDAGGALPVKLPSQYSVLYTVPPSRHSMSDIRLERLLSLLTPAPHRFVYISTTGVYGNRDGALVDEETEVKPETDRARRRVAAEESLQTWADEHDCAVVILRVPGIYGPGRLGIERIQEGLPMISEQEAGPGNRIHVDDLVSCCTAALARTVPAGIYNVGDGDLRSSPWFMSEVARQCQLQAPPTISMQDAERTFTPMRLSFLGESRRVDTKKMRAVLGVTPRYANAEDGIRATLVKPLLP